MFRIRRILSGKKVFSYKLIDGEGAQNNKYFAVDEDEMILAKILD